MVSVLFVDLVGFTPLSETSDAEEIRALLTRYFDRAQSTVERFGGAVDKFIGDAVTAVWGGVAAHEDDAERAVRAGLELVELAARLGDELGHPLAARAGVMTGETSVGPGGNRIGLVVGDLVNTASRLQADAEPGTVLVGEATARLVGDAVELRPLGSSRLKGKADPVPVWQALRVVAERGGRDRTELAEPLFVGRQAELRLLKDVAATVSEEGRARLVSVMGQAGIGKSRLVRELQRYLDGLVEVFYWHEGRSPAYGEGIALWALGEMIRQRAGLSETDDDATTRSRLLELGGRWLPDPTERDWVLPRLAVLLGLEGPTHVERHELLAAARALFEAISREGTTVLVFEDLHWADPALLELVEELPEWSYAHPILVIALARPDLLERRPSWGRGRRGFVSLHLGPLDDPDVHLLVTSLTPGLGEDTVSEIVSRSGGVPMFAVELVRMLADDPDRAVEVPESVQAVISARIDRLAPALRGLVRDAAIVGHSFTLDALAAVRDADPAELEEQLSELVRRELIELVRDPRSPERGQYRWVQSLIREVAHRRISRDERRRAHLAIARHLLAQGDPELTPVAAAHFEEALEASSEEQSAELRGEAQSAMLAALERARDLRAHEQVLSLADRALGFVEPGDARRVDLLEQATHAATRLLETETAERYAGILAAEADQYPSYRHRALATQAGMYVETGRPDQAVRLLEAELGSGIDTTEHPDLARATTILAHAYLRTGQMQTCVEASDRALAGAERFELIPLVVEGLINRGTALADLGRSIEGRLLLQGALGLCRDHDLVTSELRARINLAYSSPSFGEALDLTLETLEEARRSGDRNRASYVAANTVGYLTLSLRLDHARQIQADPLYRMTELQTASFSALIGALAGDHEPLGPLRDRLEALITAEADIQQAMGSRRFQHALAFLDGRFREVCADGLAMARSTVINRVFNLQWPAWAAAWSGDPTLLAEVAAELRMIHGHRTADHWLMVIETVDAILDGREEEGLAGLEAAASWWKGEGLGLERCLALAVGAAHLPWAHPRRGELAREAREVAVEAGAAGLVRFLDAQLSSSSASTSERSPSP